jgi:lathosterol oxidase
MDQFIHDFIYEMGFITQFLCIVSYLFFLYFVVGHAFIYSCRVLARKGWLEKISLKTFPRAQYLVEKKNAIIAIIIIAITGFFQFYFVRISWIKLAENTLMNTIIGLIILNIWNEIHFFVIHRVLHTPFMMKHVHTVHHKSIIPSVFSAYNLHWFEAFLLSTVTITITFFIEINFITLFIYPLNSLLINFAGHSNYKLKNNFINRNFLDFCIKHNNHHVKFNNHYGFLSGFLDKMLAKFK